MKYLLDTHTYLWFRDAADRLSPRVFDIVTDASYEVWISVIVPWEIAIKSGAGKLNAQVLLHDFEPREIAAGFMIAQASVTQTIRSGLLPRYHRDPFDRLLIAQSLDLGAPILSRDVVFDLYGVQRIWD